MFWSGMLLGTAGYILLSKKADISEKEKEGGRNIPGVLRFFSNPPAKVMDGILLVSLAGSIYCMVNVTVNQTVALIFLLFLIIGIYAHCLLNGKVYRHIWSHAVSRTQEKMVEGEEEGNEG